MAFFGGIAYGLADMLQAGKVQSQIEENTQRAQYMKMQNLLAQQRLRSQKAIASYMQSEQATDRNAVQQPGQMANLYEGAARIAAQNGDFSAAAQMSSLARGQLAEKAEATKAVAAKVKQAKSDLSDAAWSFTEQPSSATATDLVRSAINAGVNPTTIPAPGTAAFMTWAGQQKLASMTGDQKARYITSVQENQERRADRLQMHADAEQEHRDSMAMRAQAQASAEADRQERLALEKKRTNFTESEQLNRTLQKQAQPYVDDLDRITAIQGLLATDSPAADQQIHQGLVALYGQFRTRATDLFYKDNRNFGDVEERVSGFLSHAFAGRYSQENRKQIWNMLENAKSMLVDPALKNLTTRQKMQAAKYNLDPDLISIQNAFPDLPKTPPEPKFVKRNDATPSAPLPAGTRKVINGVTWEMGTDGRPHPVPAGE